MSYCPTCGHKVLPSAQSCERCTADFGKFSLLQPCDVPPKHPTFIERPKRQRLASVSITPKGVRKASFWNALLAVPVIALTGPALLAAFGGLHPFVVIGALLSSLYFGVPAAVVFSIQAVVLSLFKSQTEVRGPMGALLGATAGGFVGFVSIVSWDQLRAGGPFVLVCMMCGGVGGALAGHFFPIGKRTLSDAG